jgi:hypothetical protein
MEITYEQQHPKGTFNNDIRIPVPKGKTERSDRCRGKIEYDKEF